MVSRTVQLLGRLLLVLVLAGAGQQAAAQTVVDLVRQARAAQGAGDRQAALDALLGAEAMLRAMDRPPAGDLAFVLNEIAVVARALPDPATARDAAGRAVAIMERAPASDLLVAALINRGLASGDLLALAAARDDLERAIGIARDLGLAGLELAALRGAGAIALQQGLPAQAEAILDAALPLAADPPARAAVQHLRAQGFLARRMPGAAADALSGIDPAALPAALGLETRLLQGRLALQQADPARAEDLLSAVADAPDAPQALRASALYNLAEVRFARGRYAEAEIANQKAETAYAAALGPAHPVIGQIRHRQAVLLQQVGDLELALGRYDEALALIEAALGREHPLWWGTLAERAQALSRLGRHGEALAIARSVLDAAAGRPEAPDATRVLALAALGLALREAGDDAAARPVLERMRAARGAGEFSVVDEPPGLNALAEIYLAEGRVAEARALVDRSLAILEALGSTGSDLMGEARRIRAAVALAEGDRAGALETIRRSLAETETRLIDLARTDSYAADFAPVKLRGQLAQAVALLFEEAATGTTGDMPRSGATARDEIFRAVQLVHLNEATRATNGFVRGIAASDPDLAADLAARRVLIGTIRTLSEQVAQGTAGREVLARLAELRAARAALDARIASAEPGAAQALTPTPVPLGAAQALLPPGTGLWLHAALGAHSYVFLLTRDGVEMARTDLGEAELDARVRSLRATLDLDGPDGLRPFDLATSAALYDGLFGPFEQTITGLQRLLLVPDHAAQQMSLAVLVRSETPIGTRPDGADARFLGLTHALAVVPSITSLAALQRAGIADPTAGSFIGFGDPALDGGGLPDGFRGSPIDRLTGIARAGTVAAIFQPLPETVYELTTMASVLPEDRRRLFFRDDATETRVKSLSAAGGGADAGALAFATHAIVSGEFDHRNEPALVLTPPRDPTHEDDGLLTASEIATLDFRAAIVILSACNTGSTSGRSGAPGLSGLASGFFRAGAQSVVVSHWTIASVSSVLIMPRFFTTLAADDPPPPSEALRRSMVAMSLRTENPLFAHPALWGPFTVVGAN